MDRIGDWSAADLRRFIANSVLSDPGSSPKSQALPPAADGDVPVWDTGTGSWVSSSKRPLPPRNVAFRAQRFAAPSTITFTTVVDTGVTFTTQADGLYLIWGVFDIAFPANTGGDTSFGTLMVNGVSQVGSAIAKDGNTAAGQRDTVSQVWLLQIPAGQVVKTRVQRNTATGTAQLINSNTTMTVIQVA